MIDIDDFLPEVMTHAPNAPEPLVMRYIREVAQDLCRRTRFWREWDDIAVFGDADGEGVCAIPDAQIYKIEDAALVTDESRFKLVPVTPAWLDSNIPGWKYDYDGTEATPSYVVQTRPNTIMVVPKATGTLKVRLVLLPSRDAITLPDFLLEQYAPDIGKGAAARILALPVPEFANPALAAVLWGEFQGRLDTLAHEAQKTQLSARPRTKASWF
jgi:hypothetical protein